MASHVEVKPCAAAVDWRSVDASDLEEGWNGVELALAYVGQMVSGLDVDGDGDSTHRGDDQVVSYRPPTLPPSLQRDDKDDCDDDDDDDVDNDARRCINDTCELL